MFTTKWLNNCQFSARRKVFPIELECFVLTIVQLGENRILTQASVEVKSTAYIYNTTKTDCRIVTGRKLEDVAMVLRQPVSTTT